MTLKATVVMPKLSGVTADAATNSFYFGDESLPDPTTADMDVIAGWLERFYDAPNPTIGGQALASMISGTIVRGAGAWKVIFHHRPRVAPDNQLHVKTISVLTNPVTNAYADNVACALSFVDQQYAASLHPRRDRGRVYIGPLATAGVTATVTTDPRPSANLEDGLADAAARLKADSGAGLGGLWAWTVWSTADGDADNVHNGWIDNRLDSQRRRQVKATARTTFS